MPIIHVLVFLLGFALVLSTLFSAIQTFVLPRSAPDQLTWLVFIIVRRFFALLMIRTRTYRERDRVMAFFAPISLLLLVPVWYLLILLGYTGMFWAIGINSWFEAFRVSGSSLFTLGFAVSEGFTRTALEFSAAMLGLLLVALLIAYLPTMYAAFSRRESAVTLLEVRAGNPPSAVEMIQRFYRIHGLSQLSEVWSTWETWFADVEESHTSLPALVFFRSPQPDHSWITAVGAVLDAAALTLAAVDIPYDAQAALCIRAGYLCLQRIADFFKIPYHPHPHFPAQGISVTREEFDQACALLASGGLPLKTDLDLAWTDFAGWRVNYDSNLLAFSSLTMAPTAPWSSDRSPQTIRL